MAKKISYEDKRKQNYKTRYGISVEEYDEIFAKQNGVCAICEKPENVTRSGRLHMLAVDHNHETLQVRGLLCMNCNTRLGYFEGKNILVKLMAYLMRQA